MNKVLVITVTFNGMKWMEKCICSVGLSRVPADMFIIDNGSTDGTPEFIEEEFPWVKLYRSPSNLGFGQANNIGLKYALENGYDYVYLLNQDAWIEATTLGCLIAAFEASLKAGERFGILSPMQKSGDLSGRLDANFLKWYRISKPITESGIKEMDFVMAAHWMICRQCVEDVGGFSPAFSQYGEDDNYIHRARYFGWKAGAVNEAFAVHDRAQRQESKDKRMRLKCIGQIVKASDPGAGFLRRIALRPFVLTGMSIKNLSLEPIKFIPEFFGRVKELSALRKESMRKGAFL